MKKRKFFYNLIFYICIIFFVTVILLPFVWQFLTSIKPVDEIKAIPVIWFPSRIHTQYYFNVFQLHPFHLYLRNSFIVASSTTFLAMLIGSMAAYALARLRFKGKKIVLLLMLSVSMFPTIATLSPLFLILRSFRLLNTYAGLIIPYLTFSLPFSIWLMTNYFSRIPKGFEEAAAIDGCNRVQIYLKVMFPLIIPGIFSAGLLVFINSWNEFIYALTFMTRREMRTVPVGIALFPSGYELPWGDIAAGSIVVVIPLIILVLIFQKRIIAGLTTGGVKE